MNSGFKNNKPKHFHNEVDNNRWFFTQAGVKLLTINEKVDGVIVSLLRFTNSEKPFTNVTSWKLPFKLNNIKAFLMYPYLSDEEKNDENLMKVLKQEYASDQIKFENLIKARVESIINSLTTDVNKYAPRQREISATHDYGERLTNIYSPSYKDNIFIKDVKKNNKI